MSSRTSPAATAARRSASAISTSPLPLRTDVDGEGDYEWDVMVPGPHDDECTGRAWAPVYSVTCLFRAPNGDLEDDEDIVCTVHGPNNGDDQDDDPDGRADLETQAQGVGVNREVSGESRRGTAIRREMS